MTVLEELNGLLFDIDLSADKKTVTITEACDYNFSIDLDRDRFGQLIIELLEIRSQMEKE